MIAKETYQEEHIRQIQKASRKDPLLIERALYAMGLLEALAQAGMPFIFKGGSCLMLLLPKIMRLSTDVDIVVEPGTDILYFIKEAATIFPFVDFEEQHRIGKNAIVKQHFKFKYYSPVRKEEFYILLDVLFEENNYETLVQKEISNQILLTEGDNLKISVPTIDCLLGDKLTAFAPATTGIPLAEDTSLEVMKQFYDISTFLEYHSVFKDVASSYRRIAEAEIRYRGLKITAQDVLEDTIDAAITVAARGKKDTKNYSIYLDGIHRVATHIMNERFSGEIASYRAANLIYMATCILTDVPYEKIEDYEEYIKYPLVQKDLKILSKMKKAQPLSYAYLVQADRLLAEYRR